MALSPKTARTLNKKNKMSCAAVGQKTLFEPIQNVCVHKRTAGRSSEWRVQFSAAAWTCWESPLMSLSLAGCSTPEPRRLRKPDHRRWRDESVERQERRWLLIAVVADAVRQDLKQAAVRWRGTVVPNHGDSDTQVEKASLHCPSRLSIRQLLDPNVWILQWATPSLMVWLISSLL